MSKRGSTIIGRGVVTPKVRLGNSDDFHKRAKQTEKLEATDKHL